MKLLFRDKGHWKQATHSQTHDRVSVWSTPAYKIRIRTYFSDGGRNATINVCSMRHGDNQWHDLYYITLHDDKRLFEADTRPPEEAFDELERQGRDRAVMILDGE